MKSKAQTIAKWKRGVATGGDAYKHGVTNPSRDWATATAASASAWEAGVSEAVSNGKFAAGVNASGVDAKWKANSQGKGAARWQASVNDPATQSNYSRGVDKLYADIDAGLQAIAGIPRTTAADRENRMLTFSRAMKDAAGKNK